MERLGGRGGLYLLVEKGQRPDIARFEKAVSGHRSIAITHRSSDDTADQFNGGNNDPAVAQLPLKAVSDHWIELLFEGLTFDLAGFSPGEPPAFPPVETPFDLELLPASQTHDCLHLYPGHHLAGAQNSLPVMRGMFGLARTLLHIFDEIEAVVWPPARSAMGKAYFESTMTAWLEGGAFPALGLTTFKMSSDGAMESEGLAYWIGQELRIEPPLVGDKVVATRLGIRLINQLVLVGGIDESERVIAPDGSRLIMRPSRNGQFVRIFPD